VRSYEDIHGAFDSNALQRIFDVDTSMRPRHTSAYICVCFAHVKSMHSSLYPVHFWFSY